MKLVVVLLCASVCLSVAAPGAHACSCFRPKQPCERFGVFDTVFTGTVTAIDPGDPLSTLTIEVGEVFRGSVGTTVLLVNDDACGFSFGAGNSYLVYASTRTGGALYVSMCSRTRVLNKLANDDLRFLRSLASRRFATVEGAVTLDAAPHAGAVVRAQGTSHEATTDASGRYRLELPVGAFTLAVDMPGTVQAPRSVAITNVGQCEKASFQLRWNGRIRGRLLDHHGKPAANIMVQARPSAGSDDRPYVHGPQARSDAEGRYEIASVAAGTYHVVVGHRFDPDEGRPPTYYPGVADKVRARAVTVSRAEAADGIDFKLPAPYKMRRVAVEVIHGPQHLGASTIRVQNTRARREHTRSVSSSRGTTLVLAEQDGAELLIDACNGDGSTRACSETVTVKLTKDRHVKLELNDELPMPRLP